MTARIFFCNTAHSSAPPVLASGGIPCVVFGQGDIAQAHTSDEWISVEALDRGKRMLRRFLESFA